MPISAARASSNLFHCCSSDAAWYTSISTILLQEAETNASIHHQNLLLYLFDLRLLLIFFIVSDLLKFIPKSHTHRERNLKMIARVITVKIYQFGIASAEIA